MYQKSKNNSAQVLVFSCSGGPDVGELTDQTAKWLIGDGSGRMYCLPVINEPVNKYIINSTRNAKKIIIIDGCSRACTKKSLDKINVSGYKLDLEKIGFQKGESPFTGWNINKVVTHILKELRQQ